MFAIHSSLLLVHRFVTGYKQTGPDEPDYGYDTTNPDSETFGTLEHRLTTHHWRSNITGSPPTDGTVDESRPWRRSSLGCGPGRTEALLGAKSGSTRNLGGEHARASLLRSASLRKFEDSRDAPTVRKSSFLKMVEEAQEATPGVDKSTTSLSKLEQCEPRPRISKIKSTRKMKEGSRACRGLERSASARLEL